MQSARAIFTIVALFLLLACGERSSPARPASDPAQSAQKAAKEVPSGSLESGREVECPVCGLRFDAAEAKHSAVRGEERYYFLLEDHKKAFEVSPETYLHD